MRRIERPFGRRVTPAVFSLALVAFCASASVAQRQSNALAGSWEGAYAGQQLTLALKDDGTGTLNGQPFKYAVRGRNLVAEAGGEVYTYSFSLEGDRLTISGGVFEGASVTFTRKGAAGEGPSGGGARSSGSGGGSRAGGSSGGGGLVGRWRSSEATVEIRDDGTLVLNGDALRYRVRGNTITITGDEGSADLPFRLAGDTLTVEFQGREIVYKRVAEGNQESGGADGRPAELAGQWCYLSNVNTGSGGRISNICFELSADGRYTYRGETSSSGPVASSASQEYDEGTWTATATTITAHSRSGRVTTFRLEKRNHPKNGDPMLVLDGNAFVTATQRPPWP